MRKTNKQKIIKKETEIEMKERGKKNNVIEIEMKEHLK